MEDKATIWEIALLRLGMPFSRYLLFFSLPATPVSYTHLTLPTICSV